LYENLFFIILLTILLTGKTQKTMDGRHRRVEWL